MKKTNFHDQGLFYIGNIHCHSTLSDGQLSAGQLKNIYKARGYSFVLFSDHNKNTNYNELNDESFIALQGFEGSMKVLDLVPQKQYHFIFMKAPDKSLARPFDPYSHLFDVDEPAYYGPESLREYLDAQISKGYMAVLNHPYWSFNDIEDIKSLGNKIIGIELYNHNCEILENVGHSELLYDSMLRYAYKYLAFASDDNHNHHPIHSAGSDSFGGFIAVKAKSLCEEDIVTAIFDGSFYASMGPEIHDFFIENGIAKINCSPVERIYITNDKRDYQMKYDSEGNLCCFETMVANESRYVRAEIVDRNGKKAYTNPIWLGQ